MFEAHDALMCIADGAYVTQDERRRESPDHYFKSADEMIALEEGAVQHMNDDHHDAIQRYAGRLLGAEPGGWKITAIDPDGADLRRGDDVLRLPFEKPVYSGGALRVLLAKLGERTKD
jgi:putative heme iron utilization protein